MGIMYCIYAQGYMPQTQRVGYELEDFGVMWVWRFRTMHHIGGGV